MKSPSLKNPIISQAAADGWKVESFTTFGIAQEPQHNFLLSNHGRFRMISIRLQAMGLTKTFSVVADFEI